MKKILVLIPLCLFLAACSDFLEYKDKDKIIPKTLTHFEELIFGEIIQKADGSELHCLNYMSDETTDRTAIPCWSDADDRVTMFPYYTWAVDNQTNALGVEHEDGMWSWLYHKILMCNVVEYEVSLLEEDRENMKTRLLGEVACIRAISYFYLVNLYGEVYENVGQAKDALGVPINNETGIEKIVYERSSLQAVYDLIEKDLIKAIDLLEKGEQVNSKFRPNVDVAKLFLSRIYLYQKKYDKTITVCNDLISSSEAHVLTRDKLAFFSSTGDYFYNNQNLSIFFSWGKKYTLTIGKIGTSKGTYVVSPSFLDAFGNDGRDIRKTAFFEYDSSNDYYCPRKYGAYKNALKDRAYRMEEIYFNRAEAYIESDGADNLKKALDDIYEIRQNRISGDYHLSVTSREEIRQALRDEKKLEFCFEEMRWFDIRRWGLEVTHVYHDISNMDVSETYVLRKGSPNYALSLPLQVQRHNDVIKQIEREETLVK